ncbi:DUF1176 domain-containing protein [Thiothrix lacustris]|uniref:DUF1176 domain-containing protein n=1 Tax=Thiothrix lacustris TaxID=525917 RepID=UPI0027E4B6A6|nr:DUF1176 domain-containing protein [Thiothrix lacustris]WMP15948.1 DUF1176 domain-containing protein [Thiothrix lacustris]
MKMHLILCGIVLLPLPLLGATASLNQVKTFKDWVVACNNIRACTATSLMFQDDGSGEMSATIRLERSNKPGDAPVFSLNLGYDTLPAALLGKPVQLRAAGKTLNVGKLTSNQQKQSSITIPAEHNTALLAMISKPALLEIAIGSSTYRATLSGLASSLLYMDEQQKRLDTTTALIRKGNKAMTAIPPSAPIYKAVLAPKSMKVPADLSSTVRTNMASVLTDCDPNEGDYKVSKNDFAEALDTNHYLVGITCFSGAYNQTSNMFVVTQASAASAKPQITPAKLEFHKGSNSQLVNASFDPKTGLLSEYSKARGLGDCGSLTEWVWTGKQFAAVKYDSMPECRGVVDYLNVWTATIGKSK